MDKPGISSYPPPLQSSITNVSIAEQSTNQVSESASYHAHACNRQCKLNYDGPMTRTKCQKVKNQRVTEHYDTAIVAGVDRANSEHHSFGLTELPKELHLEICKYLGSKSMMALRLSNSIFQKNIRPADLKNQIKAEFEVMKTYYTEKFLTEFRVDESGKFIGGVDHLYSTFKKQEDRKPLEQLIIEILSNDKITEYLKTKNSAFNHALQFHSVNGKLPARENWNKYQEVQIFRDDDERNITWIDSVVCQILCHYHP
ncbi:hypothetical protein ACTL6P_07025 [Endozoicomonas acroporae]|uniref:hypothetical protein n=1 Tax=Endozoicomonas acroporae TaxID=1701104 RepID=UPI000C762D98|nr:hypothetical protein [Endozoicomonas acroporae]